MTDEQFNSCYRAVKEYLADIGFVPNGDTLKTLLKSVGNDQLYVASPESDISGKAQRYMKEILDSIKYENGNPSHFLQASIEQQTFINTGAYGKLTEDVRLNSTLSDIFLKLLRNIEALRIQVPVMMQFDIENIGSNLDIMDKKEFQNFRKTLLSISSATLELNMWIEKNHT